MKTVIITATPPTPNGDLHIGHLSGPYLNADVYARYTRLRGNHPLYVSFSDHNQTYVVTTAAKTDEAPMALADRYADDIRATLSMAGIEPDTFHNPDARHDAFVKDFFSNLYEQGKLKKKKKKVFVNSATGAHVFEAYLKGNCRTCYSETSGAICEACGHPNDPASIDLPRIALTPAVPLIEEEVELVYLELEPYRRQIVAFYREQRGAWRPHLVQLVDELLAKPLADYPVTYRSGWGIAAPFPGCDGQVLNVWAEMFPGLINGANVAAERRDDMAGDGPWSGTAEVVQFLGYDNSYFFALVHLVLAFASGGRYAPPAWIITNEFYELDNYKFSTSKRHVIWGRDILQTTATDPLRFYLCLSNPEGQKMNFTVSGFREMTVKRLQAPWRGLIADLAACARQAGVARVDLGDIAASSAYGGARDRFAHFFQAEHFSLQRLAEHLSQLLVCAQQHAARLRTLPAADVQRQLPDLVSLVAWVIPLVCAPLMPGFAAQVRAALGLPAVTRWDEPAPGNSVAMECVAALERLLALDKEAA